MVNIIYIIPNKIKCLYLYKKLIEFKVSVLLVKEIKIQVLEVCNKIYMY